MRKFTRKHLRMLPIVPLLVLACLVFILPPLAAAAPLNISAAAVDPGALPAATANQTNIKNILSIAFGIIGSLAVLMMTISGFKYITSGGDPQRASEAKNGILFALIGLVIAILAEAIVAYVVLRT